MQKASFPHVPELEEPLQAMPKRNNQSPEKDRAKFEQTLPTVVPKDVADAKEALADVAREKRIRRQKRFDFTSNKVYDAYMSAPMPMPSHGPVAPATSTAAQAAGMPPAGLALANTAPGRAGAASPASSK